MWDAQRFAAFQRLLLGTIRREDLVIPPIGADGIRRWPQYLIDTLLDPRAGRTERWKLFCFLWRNGVEPTIVRKYVLFWFLRSGAREFTNPTSKAIAEVDAMVKAAMSRDTRRTFNLFECDVLDLTLNRVIKGYRDRYERFVDDWVKAGGRPPFGDPDTRGMPYVPPVRETRSREEDDSDVEEVVTNKRQQVAEEEEDEPLPYPRYYPDTKKYVDGNKKLRRGDPNDLPHDTKLMRIDAVTGKHRVLPPDDPEYERLNIKRTRN
jgi:hypothetical protein